MPRRNTQILISTPLWIAKSSAIHGTGLFAARDIPADTRLIEYIGRKISKAESKRLCKAQNSYVFEINDEYDIDGSVDWNIARYINHSCAPNCEADHDENDRIWIDTLVDIKAGEEFSYNYGYDLDDYQDSPCHCGAPNCLGYMVAEEYVPEVRRRLARAKA